MAPLSPTRCCPETPLRCEGERSRAKVPGPALSRQREVQLHRLGRPATDRGGTRRKPRLRLHHRHHRPTGAGQADQRDHPAVHPGGVHGRTRRQVGGPPQVHNRREEDHHHHRPEVPLHPGRHRQRPPGPEVRHHHRRGPLQPGRESRRRRGPGPWGRARRRGGRRYFRGSDQPDHREPEAPVQRLLPCIHRHPQEQDPGDSSERRTRNRTGRSGTCPSTTTR